MTTAELALSAILLLTLVLQAAWPARRVLIVTSGAALSSLVASLLGVATTSELLADVPWDVLVVLVTLGLLSQLFAASRLFDRLAVRATRVSRGAPLATTLVFAVAMYLVSGVVNNLTALLLVLPVIHVVVRLSAPSQRYVSWTLGTVLVACNLGGAATPIGDFPAILLLGSGSIGFGDYLVRALPITLAALAILLALVALVVRPARDVPFDPLSTRLTRASIEALHRHVRIDRALLVPAASALGAMMIAWIALPPEAGIGPELVCWIGVGGALLASRGLGERLARVGIDSEAVLFLLSLFVMVGALARTGIFDRVALAITTMPVPPEAQLVIFLLVAGLLTGVFSAGPSMAALLGVADALAERLPPHAVYVGLALAVCAGSSLLLTAATSGPLAQALTDRAALRDPDGRILRFGFFEFLPVGIMSFAVIMGCAFAWAALAMLTS
ncbi:MAG: permease [Deltaproteobacteria bacterium]|nr:permease [Deltaproteobacteria bacterium]